MPTVGLLAGLCSMVVLSARLQGCPGSLFRLPAYMGSKAAPKGWSSLLAWLSDLTGLWDGLCNCPYPPPRLLGEAGTGGCAQQLGRVVSLLSYLGEVVEWVHGRYGLLFTGDPSQAELAIELSGQKGLSSADGQRACLGSLLSGSCKNVVCQDLCAGCYKPHSPSLSLSDLQKSSLTNSPLIPIRQDPSGPPGRCPATGGGALFTHWWNLRSREAFPCSTVLTWGGQWGQGVAVPLTFLMLSFSVSAVQGPASASSPGSGIFTMVSCLWKVASCSSCEGTEVRNDLYCHPDSVTTSNLLHSLYTLVAAAVITKSENLKEPKLFCPVLILSEWFHFLF